MDSGSILGGRTKEKSRKNGVENHAFLGLRFFSVFFRFFVIFHGFWEAPGLPKIAKKLKKSRLGRFWSALRIFMLPKRLQSGSQEPPKLDFGAPGP